MTLKGVRRLLSARTSVHGAIGLALPKLRTPDHSMPFGGPSCSMFHPYAMQEIVNWYVDQAPVRTI